MTEVWRLVKKRHIHDAFTGEGSRVVSGRWHHRGIPVVYTSQTLSLAALELFVNLGTEGTLITFASFRVVIPDDVIVEEITTDSLPKDWRHVRAPDSTRDMGTMWVKRGSSAVLRVPSVIIPVEYNYVLNPLHGDFTKIKIGSPEPFSFDPRMWKK